MNPAGSIKDGRKRTRGAKQATSLPTETNQVPPIQATTTTTTTNNIITTETARPEDVISVRGMGGTKNPGNVMFRRLVHNAKQSFKENPCGKFRRSLAEKIIAELSPGRFLKKKDPSDPVYQVMDYEASIEKVVHAARDAGRVYGKRSSSGGNSAKEATSPPKISKTESKSDVKSGKVRTPSSSNRRRKARLSSNERKKGKDESMSKEHNVQESMVRVQQKGLDTFEQTLVGSNAAQSQASMQNVVHSSQQPTVSTNAVVHTTGDMNAVLASLAAQMHASMQNVAENVQHPTVSPNAMLNTTGDMNAVIASLAAQMHASMQNVVHSAQQPTVSTNAVVKTAGDMNAVIASLAAQMHASMHNVADNVQQPTVSPNAVFDKAGDMNAAIAYLAAQMHASMQNVTDNVQQPTVSSNAVVHTTGDMNAADSCPAQSQPTVHNAEDNVQESVANPYAVADTAGGMTVVESCPAQSQALVHNMQDNVQQPSAMSNPVPNKDAKTIVDDSDTIQHASTNLTNNSNQTSLNLHSVGDTDAMNVFKPPAADDHMSIGMKSTANESTTKPVDPVVDAGATTVTGSPSIDKENGKVKSPTASVEKDMKQTSNSGSNKSNEVEGSVEGCSYNTNAIDAVEKTNVPNSSNRTLTKEEESRIITLIEDSVLKTDSCANIVTGLSDSERSRCEDIFSRIERIVSKGSEERKKRDPQNSSDSVWFTPSHQKDVYLEILGRCKSAMKAGMSHDDFLSQFAANLIFS